jgi:threonylcarbamoyladenosine tRNA methylthiotransferase MtaB
MNRPYTRKKIQKVFEKLKQIPKLKFGTDIIVGFPNETKKDFRQTLTLCRQIGFTKIHVFRYSPRPGTSAQKLFLALPKIKNTEKIHRSRLISQSTLPSHQTP